MRLKLVRIYAPVLWLILCIGITLSMCGAVSGQEKKSEKKEEMIGSVPRHKVMVYKEMLLPVSVFAPDKWWQYRTDDDDFHMVYCVQQSGTVNMGGQNPPRMGGMVEYKALACKNEKEAKTLYSKWLPIKSKTRYLRVKTVRVIGADQGQRFDYETVDNKRVKVTSSRIAVMRYGRFLVNLKGYSNMKAMVTAPKTGERPFLSEPVFDKAYAGILGKWSRYKQVAYNH